MILIYYLVLINVFTFYLFGLDKYRAGRRKKRISEKNLFLAALAGGTPGALAGMYIFRHKTTHRKFTMGLPALLLAQTVAVIIVINNICA